MSIKQHDDMCLTATVWVVSLPRSYKHHFCNTKNQIVVMVIWRCIFVKSCLSTLASCTLHIWWRRPQDRTNWWTQRCLWCSILKGEVPPLLGAVPPMQSCLDDPKVCWELRDASQNNCRSIVMAEMQETSKIFWDLLHMHWFDGSLLHTQLKKKQKHNITVTHSATWDVGSFSRKWYNSCSNRSENFNSDDMFNMTEVFPR